MIGTVRSETQLNSWGRISCALRVGAMHGIAGAGGKNAAPTGFVQSRQKWSCLDLERMRLAGILAACKPPLYSSGAKVAYRSVGRSHGRGDAMRRPHS